MELPRRRAREVTEDRYGIFLPCADVKLVASFFFLFFSYADAIYCYCGMLVWQSQVGCLAPLELVLMLTSVCLLALLAKQIRLMFH